MKNKYEVVYSSRFRKNYRKILKRGLKVNLLHYVVDELALGHKLEEKYCDHALKGSSNRYRECHIQPDWLLIYKIEDNVLILTLIDTGTHSDLFKK